jgi:hypothetical protein
MSYRRPHEHIDYGSIPLFRPPLVRYLSSCATKMGRLLVRAYVRGHRAGERVMASVTRFLTTKLRLKVNETKSAVARPEERKFLGFSICSRIRVLTHSRRGSGNRCRAT